MAILGAHMSIAGGFDKAVERAAEAGCDCLQVFVSNPRQFPRRSPADRSSAGDDGGEASGDPIDRDQVDRFHAALARHGIVHPIAHASYLINLATPDDTLWQKSLEALGEELRRAELLGLEALVLHPGSHLKLSEDEGLRRVIAALDAVHERTPGYRVKCLLETTAGQGTNLGYRFEHLATLLEGVAEPQRLGVCFDTCHVFAAGYELVSRRGYLATMRALHKLLDLDRIRAFHLNDSQRERGSRVDRHAHIGQGELGLEPFRHLLNDRRFRQIPMYLETPKGKCRGRSWDELNLRELRALIAG